MVVIYQISHSLSDLTFNQTLNFLQPKNQSKSERTKLQRSALIKYSSKIQHASVPHCLLVLEATLESSPSRFKAVTLMLTSQSLIVLSADGDSIESTLLLNEIILPENDADPTMLTISFKGAPPVVSFLLRSLLCSQPVHMRDSTYKTF